MRCFAALPAIGTALFACPAFSDTWLIRPDGNGDFPTIALAIGGAADGDVIELADGIYSGAGNRDVWVYDRTITIRSQSGDPSACLIDPEGGPGLTRRAINFQGTGPGLVIENITFTGGSALNNGASGYGGAMLFNDHSSPTFIGCVFVDNHANRGGAIFTYDFCSPSIIDCTFLNNTATSYGGAISLSVDSAPSIEGGIFRGNSAGSGGALSVWNGAAPTLTNCTFYGNSAPGGGAVAWCRSGGAPAFINSILAFSTNGSAIACDSGDGLPTLACCTLFGNAGGDWVDCIEGLGAGNGNMSADPLFCDPANEDLRLEWGSPCLSAHSGGCGQIGVWGPGNCPSSPVEDASWGLVKGWYR